ncbi:PREDICTED: CASP-like protein 1C1 [Camelina sativa]|uniref:CASP-like protein n=1 Tax=Camelina sativa TaxID=90675 RepID=A0ABM0VGP7_CAMSA|nr:PREDICTED: CASP-like protein 1C1 [Camelina sativa]XP_010431136.1 PREDICTED: CASP-like protein 1C1 [Camelina sativa]XP_010455883.1 PREDICTED: CASP-like protein 1C1 [Camelina sativa]
MVKLTKRIGGLVLRLAAFGAALAALIVMVTSRERASFFAVSLEAKYTDMAAFKYFVIANAVVSVYSFLVLFLPKESLLWKFVVVLDLVMTMLLTSSLSAALAVAQVGKKGNANAGWLPICGQVPKFCDQVTGALIAGFVALVLYVLLLLYSLHSVVDPFLLQKS